MMRLTIIKDDNLVGIDGIFYTVDLNDLPADFHALQWYGEYNEGEVEWNGRPKPPNTIINELGEYSVYIDRWNQAKSNEDALIAQENALGNQQTT